MTNNPVMQAKNAAYRFLTYRSRSSAEVERQLKGKGFSDNVVATVLADLIRLGYVDDREFSRQWASSRVRHRRYGRRRIEQELREKGVGHETIQEALNEVFEDVSEVDLARTEAQKKLETLDRFESGVRRRRLFGFLERRGFSSGSIRRVFREMYERL